MAKLLLGAWPAALYLIAALGWGRILRPRFLASADATLVSATLGLAFVLTWSHVMGQLGLASGATGLIAAWAPIAAGIALLGYGVSARRQTTAKPHEPLASLEPRQRPVFELVPGIFGGAALLLAATLSPGAVWPSEFGGFDSLSYHLPLPQEWLARGRLEPLAHNTYSYLPSYLEAAFLHLLVLTNAPVSSNPASGQAAGMLAGNGWRTISCQFLHAGLGIWTAWATGRAVGVFARSLAAPGEPEDDSTGAALARSVVLCTPWTLVVGSLSYNELGVTALGAGVLCLAFDHRLDALRRGAACGVVVGVAAGVKPTAAFMLGAPAAVLLAFTTPPRMWLPLAASGTAATTVAVLPWTIRNGLACGNPVFPYATQWFGLAHWVPEQLVAYQAAHHEAGGLTHKLALALATPGNGTPRGLFHPQWATAFPLVLLGLGLCVATPRARRLGWLLVGMITTGLAAWLLLTHVQSRFLIPLVPVLATGIALGFSAGTRSWFAEGVRRVLYTAVHTALVGGLAWFLLKTPIQGALPWPTEFSGISLRPALDRALPAQRLEFFNQEIRPEWFVNLTLPSTAKVYLLGGSTPFYYQIPTVYHVAWERSRLGNAMRRTPAENEGAPEAWLADLRAEGITHILVDFVELARLLASGYSDPLVTPKAVGDWLAPRCPVVRMWGDRNSPSHVLFSIQPGPRGLAHADGDRS